LNRRQENHRDGKQLIDFLQQINKQLTLIEQGGTTSLDEISTFETQQHRKMGLEEMSTAQLAVWVDQQARKNRISNLAATAGINAINQQHITGKGFLQLSHSDWANVNLPYKLPGGYALELEDLKRYDVSPAQFLISSFNHSLQLTVGFWRFLRISALLLFTLSGFALPNIPAIYQFSSGETPRWLNFILLLLYSLWGIIAFLCPESWKTFK
jgi:hypothetical protein